MALQGGGTRAEGTSLLVAWLVLQALLRVPIRACATAHSLLHDTLPPFQQPATAHLGASGPRTPIGQRAIAVARLDVAALRLRRPSTGLPAVQRFHRDLACALPDSAATGRGASAPALPVAYLTVDRAVLLGTLLLYNQWRARGTVRVWLGHDSAGHLLDAAAARDRTISSLPVGDVAILYKDLLALLQVELGTDLLEPADLVLVGPDVGHGVVHCLRVVVLHCTHLGILEAGLLLSLILQLRGCGEVGCRVLIPRLHGGDLALEVSVQLLASSAPV
mmetsp:Transcript_30867/g.98497  ORF Transcript_30867/g.98497 Transcript_30867/m.98497 type:complete len:277 (+) Transcript_30867:717-1547(+)